MPAEWTLLEKTMHKYWNRKHSISRGEFKWTQINVKNSRIDSVVFFFFSHSDVDIKMRPKQCDDSIPLFLSALSLLAACQSKYHFDFFSFPFELSQWANAPHLAVYFSFSGQMGLPQLYHISQCFVWLWRCRSPLPIGTCDGNCSRSETKRRLFIFAGERSVVMWCLPKSKTDKVDKYGLGAHSPSPTIFSCNSNTATVQNQMKKMQTDVRRQKRKSLPILPTPQ